MEPWRLKMEPWRLILESWTLTMELGRLTFKLLSVCRLVWWQICITSMRIRISMKEKLDPDLIRNKA
jgi:hypothetical protein